MLVASVGPACQSWEPSWTASRISKPSSLSTPDDSAGSVISRVSFLPQSVCVCVYIFFFMCVWEAKLTLTLAILILKRSRLSLACLPPFFFPLSIELTGVQISALSEFYHLGVISSVIYWDSSALHLPLLCSWTKTGFFLRKLEKQDLCDQYVSQPSHEKKGTPNAIETQPCTSHSTRCFKLLLIVGSLDMKWKIKQTPARPSTPNKGFPAPS